MPYIHTQISKTLTDEAREALTRDFGEAAELIGKSEQWLMLRFEDSCRMAFRGKSDGDCCFIGISMYGLPDREQLEALTERVTSRVAERTGVAPENIYIRYLPTDAWGWNGGNF